MLLRRVGWRPCIFVRMSTEKAIGWMQLTDLHVGQPKEGGRVGGVERALLLDIEAMIVGENRPVDVVFFTGDIAFKGGVDEYVRATSILGRVLTRVQECNAKARKVAVDHADAVPLLVPVPGNHDLERPRSGDDAAVLRAAFAGRTGASKPLWTGQTGALGIVTRCFHAYSEWLSVHPLPFPATMTRGIVPGDCSTSIVRDGLALGVVGLNSAYLHLGDEGPGSLHLDLSQLHRLTGERRDDWVARHDFTVLLTHHSPSWLTETAQQILKGEIRDHHAFDLHLYGHAHLGAHVAQTGAAGVSHMIEGRSLFGAEEDGYARMHGYTLGRLVRDGESRRVEVWSRSDRDRKSGDELRFGPLDETWGRWHLVIDLGPKPGPSKPPAVNPPRKTWRPGLGNLGAPNAAYWTSVRTPAELTATFERSPRKRWLLLSASVPTVRMPEHLTVESAHIKSAVPQMITETVTLLVQRLMVSDIGLVFGGHPSITSTIAPLAMRPSKQDPWIALFQDEHLWPAVVESVGVFDRSPAVLGVLVPDDGEEDSSAKMRRLMIETPGLELAVFLGGMSGVLDEFNMIGEHCPKVSRLALGVGGGAAASLLLNPDTGLRDQAHGGPLAPAVSGWLWSSPESAVDAIVEVLARRAAPLAVVPSVSDP